MREILETLLVDDVTVTAREVARRHPSLRAASSITRASARRRLLLEYKQRQAEYRRSSRRVRKQSMVDIAATIVDKDNTIADLTGRLDMLAASHLAMLRAVGELGGFAKWAAFYESFEHTRDALNTMRAIPNDAKVTPLVERSAERKRSR